jgi:hypothetical protein
MMDFLKIGSHEIFARAGFKPPFSSSLFLEYAGLHTDVSHQCQT